MSAFNIPEIDALITKTPAGCWEFSGKKHVGYGRAYIPGKGTVYLHRFSFEMFKGPLVKGLHVDHVCRNRACCNPDHLDQVTPAENSRRSPLWNGNWGSCKMGHPYIVGNISTYINRYGGESRRCLECSRAAQRKRRALKANARWENISM